MTDKLQCHEPDLQKRVLAWLETEGFPTEFRTTMAFRAAGFHARQGVHYRADGTPREIDVVADRTLREDELWVRCKFVVECKWASKPWVIFTDKYSRIAPAACVSQTMGSNAGSALLWLTAGSSEVQKLKMFATPGMPGFGGRQAFSRGDDQFYKAMAGVTTAASTLAASYDEHRKPGEAPKHAVCVFPVVVVEGALFQAFYNPDGGEMKVEPTNHVRCHWKGSPTWKWHATVDIVTLEGLPKYLSELGPDVDKLLSMMINGQKDLRSAFECGSIASLKIHPGSRGMIGLHPLLAEIRNP
tara:strand:- start:397 stop:1296 length:900 start_codon:yes stop_codon:yes gene_type:complete